MQNKACVNSTLSVLHFPTLQSSRCSLVTLLRSSLKLGGEKICMNLDWKGKDGWQLVTKIPFNHKKNWNLGLRSKFVFSLSAGELGVRSDILALPSGPVLEIHWSQLAGFKKNFISILCFVFVCVGVIESQQSFTFFSWIQSLLFFTLFPRIFFIFSRLLSNLVGYQLFLHQNQTFTYHVNHQHCIFVITTDISIIMVIYSPYSSPHPSIAPCSNTSCSSFLSKCCWQRLSSSSHQHQEEFLCLWLPQ